MSGATAALAPPSPRSAAPVRRPWGNPWVGLVCRLMLAAVLAFAGVAKLLEPSGAREAIVAYRIPGMTPGLATALGWGLPVLEVTLAVLLLVGLFTRLAAAVTALLMVAFVAGIAGVWARGYSIDCGCFGGGGDVSEAGKTGRYAAEIGRDLLFLGAACWLVAWPVTRWALDRPPRADHLVDHHVDDDIHDHADGGPGGHPPRDAPTPVGHVPPTIDHTRSANTTIPKSTEPTP